MSNVSSANILPGFKTNHSMITLNISLHSNPRGRGFWKLNTSLLSCETFYKNLYTSQGNTMPPENESFELVNDTLLNHNDSASYEGLLTEKE